MKISGLLSFFSLVFSASALLAQAPADFSGTWMLDHSRSDSSFKDYTVTYNINQNPQTITIEISFGMQDGSSSTAPAQTFTLNGEETTKEQFGGINKESAKWSPDKKVLTITQTRTVGKNIYGSNTTYQLSENGAVLTLLTTDVNPKNTQVIKQVFTKKQ